jgi:hypothetical protein
MMRLSVKLVWILSLLAFSVNERIPELLLRRVVSVPEGVNIIEICDFELFFRKPGS